jgi:hypothetical protein
MDIGSWGEVIRMNSKESMPEIPATHESTALSAPNVKHMLGRVWAVAELLAEAAHPEKSVSRPERLPQKTQD